MKTIQRIINSFIIFLIANLSIIFTLPVFTKYKENLHGVPGVTIRLILLLLFIVIMIRPVKTDQQLSRNLLSLCSGCELLRLFIINIIPTTILQIHALILSIKGIREGMLTSWFCGFLIMLLLENIVFWNGMIRIYLQSLQLGIKHRIMALVCAWIPGLNIYYLGKMIRIVQDEVDFEGDKYKLDQKRADEQICKTKYPLVMVHGVFFRDFRYLNYWGRTPAELIKNGASVYYGSQQSAASVEECGKEIADCIRKIVEETGCGKVNIIAHSKGGLDARAAIKRYGAAPYVASLTTINTPHRGCIFADYLLNKISDGIKNTVAGSYNTAVKKFGDTSPDFIAAVSDLTASACESFNENTPDTAGILYESVMSYCKAAVSGQFPLNLSYNLVKHFDGKNDGLVAVESASWGSHTTLVSPAGKRGISHGDMIDLNRANISGFDVREFYVQLVSGLKQRGY